MKYFILLGGPTIIYEADSWQECEDVLEHTLCNRVTWLSELGDDAGVGNPKDITQFLIDNMDELYIIREDEL